MSPFEIMYGRKCTTHVSWGIHVDRLIVGPEMLQDMEKTVQQVQKNLKVAQDRRKSYVDLKRQHKYFSVGYHVYL